jgi:glycosyltransferase involved in cell wall biosynthesis
MFSYLPNGIAAAFLIDEVFPRLTEACDDCRLILVGPMPLPAMLAAAERDARIVVTGLVADVRPYLADATVMAVPLFQGGGTHLKVLEAFAAGVPVVSTRKGAEGLGAQPATHLLLAETADEFADAILALWRDHALVERVTGHARALVAERFSWASVATPLRAAIAALVPDR